MDANDIRPFLGPERFIAFDVKTESGNSYHVRSPEMTWLAPDGSTLLVWDPEKGVALIASEDVTECVRPIGGKPRRKGN